MSHAVAAPRAGRREWIGLAVLVLPVLLVSVDASVLYVALPFLTADLAPSGGQLLWIMDIYGFMLAGLLITMGTLGDRIGRRRLLMIGAAAFGTASVAAACSTSAGMLILTRGALGVAGATLMPSTLALIRNLFHGQGQRRLAIAIWTAGLGGGSVLGPLVGGLLLEHLWWGSVFLINVPVMVLLLVLVPLLLPEFRDRAAGRFDLPSAVLSLAAVLPAIYGVKQLAEGAAAGPALGAVAVGLAIGAVFVRRQRRLATPMLDLTLFRAKGFGTALATKALAVFAMIGIGLFSTQYLQLVLGMGPLQTGLFALPAVLMMMASAMLAPVLMRRVQPAYVVGTGLLLAAAGLLIMAKADAVAGLVPMVAGSATMGAGIGVVLAMAADLVIATAPPASAGAASGLVETSSEFGGALGTAILGSIGAAVYQSQLGQQLPAGLAPETAQAARQTLGDAVELARHLPDTVGTELLQAARAAYTEGLHLTTGIAAVIMAGTAIAAVTLLRRTPAGSPVEQLERIPEGRRRERHLQAV